jgi:hypothetical protein
MRLFPAAALLSAVLASAACAEGGFPAAPAAPAPVGLPAGVSWFTDLRAGLEEAKRSGRPVMLLAAAPSCGGVSGTW